MLKTVFIHGISDGRAEDWPERWKSLFGIDGAVVGISWEKIHESRYSPARSHRANLLMDLGALTNQEVQRHIQKKLRELVGQKVRIIAHSLGSVLAYQALDYLMLERCPLRDEQFITVGSPLWIPFSRITRRIASINIAMSRAAKLTNVRHWSNLAGRFDIIAGFGLVRLPPSCHSVCWATHSIESYAPRIRKML